MRDDLKAAIRSLAGSRAFTTVALLVLTLGIGASTTIFSVADAVALKKLPFDEHDRLVAIGERRMGSGASAELEALSNAAPQNYTDWEARQQVFEGMAAIADGRFVLRDPATDPEELRGQRVTASFFSVLRSRPRLGRAFTVENESEGRDRVAVLSHGLWVRRFGADPAIIGRRIAIEGGPYEVVGVMPSDFAYPVWSADPTGLWVPYVVPPDERTRGTTGRRVPYLQTIARLKPGVSIEQAQANLDQVSIALADEHPAWNKNTRAGVRPLREQIVDGRTHRWMMMLLGAVALVLLIACANVANLLLARGTSREREIGVRAALGASPWRLLRLLIVESLVLSTAATALAVLTASWAVGLVRTSMPEGVPRIADISLDLRVLGAAAVLSLVTALLSGIIPALRLSRADLTDALKNVASRGGFRGARFRGALVVGEVAFALILLVAATLFINSFRALMKIDSGLDAENVLIMNVVPRLERSFSDAPGLPDYGPQLERTVEHLSQLPGVTHAAAISGGVPLGGNASTARLTVPGRTPGGAQAAIGIRRVTPGYHAALGITLKAGRYFDSTDRPGAMPVILLNESAAREHFPAGDPLGKTVTINGTGRTIVGIVRDVRQTSLETEPRAEAYVPMAQQLTFFSELVVKTSDAPYAIAPAVIAAVRTMLPGVLVRNVRTMEQVISRQTAQRRFNMLLLSQFGLIGLAIAAAGVYGVIAFEVSRRTREIGVRVALGATRQAVLSTILSRIGVLVGVGLLIGSGGAWLVGSTAQGFLFMTDVHDPRAFAAAVGVMSLAALAASVIPARRAASVDPTIALRAE